jgi:transposase
LSDEKPRNTVGRPVIPFRKVLNGILYVLRTGCQWKILPKEFSSGSAFHRRFQQWIQADIFKKMWIKVLEEYVNKIGIELTWQSFDGISKKSLLGG